MGETLFDKVLAEKESLGMSDTAWASFLGVSRVTWWRNAKRRYLSNEVLAALLTALPKFSLEIIHELSQRKAQKQEA